MKYLTEFVGTFFFLFVIATAAIFASGFAPLAIGVVLIAMVYMGGHVSGANYNPAVSLALAMQKKLSWKDFGIYVICQIAAGLAAFALAFWVLGKTPGINPGVSPSTDLPFTNAQALVVEIVFTAMLACVVLNVAATKATSGNSYFGLAIGGTIVAAAYAGGGISGGAFNPAVGFSATAIKAFLDGGEWTHVWLYIVGPLLGGALGSTIWGLMHATSDAAEA